MESHTLMFELSHTERLKILNVIKEKPMRLSHLSNELDVTTAEVSRHLDRLVKAKLIERDPESNYHLTSLANVVLTVVSKFDFIMKNTDFFLGHDLSKIPTHLHWFNSMAKGEFSKGTLETSSMIKEASQNAEKFVYVMSDEVMRVLVEIDCEKNDGGVVFKKIYPKGADIPKEYSSRLDETFQIRTLEAIPLSLKLTENIGGVALRELDGKVDYSLGLVGENETFRRWVNAVFDHYWKQAKPWV